MKNWGRIEPWTAADADHPARTVEWPDRGVRRGRGRPPYFMHTALLLLGLFRGLGRFGRRSGPPDY